MSVDNAYILSTKDPLDPPFIRQIQQFLAQAQITMPNVHQARLLHAAAGGRVDQQVVADYASGLIWLSWRYDNAWAKLESAVNRSSEFISSNQYLKLQQDLGWFKFLPLFAEPRAQLQSLEHLLQEARLIAYLTTGR
jgi:hypothetical protein